MSEPLTTEELARIERAVKPHVDTIGVSGGMLALRYALDETAKDAQKLIAEVRRLQALVETRDAQLAAARACAVEARHYVDAAETAWKERDDLIMRDSLGHVGDALRRLIGGPRGDGYPEGYLTTDEAQAKPCWHREGRMAERIDVVAVLMAREGAERSAYRAWRESEAYMNCSHDNEHPGGILADGYEVARKEIERAEHVGAAEAAKGAGNAED